MSVLHQPNRVRMKGEVLEYSIFPTEMPGFNGATGNGSEGVAFPTGLERFPNVLDARAASDMAYRAYRFLHFK